MIRQCFPSARLHASTQCSVNTPDGVNALKELGFKRIVVPREMSLDEIKEIREKQMSSLKCLFTAPFVCAFRGNVICRQCSAAEAETGGFVLNRAV